MTTVSPTVHLDHPTEPLRRALSTDELEAYERDGAAIVKGVVPLEWVDFMRDAVTRVMERSDPSSQNYADDGEPRFFSQASPCVLDEAFVAWALHGPMPELAAQAMPTAKSVNFFYDQVFAKEPGAGKATPWHQDFPFLPLRGENILRIWVPLDPVPAQSGAVQYLRGSHRWGVVYHPPGFKDIPEIMDTYVNSPYQDPPDFEATYDDYDWMIGEAEPGDALLHHPKTVHGSKGNTTPNIRRAVTTMYTGDDVVWHPHVANMYNNKSLLGHVTVPELDPGGPIDCGLFPRVWPRE